MVSISGGEIHNGDRCKVERGTHAGKSGVVQDCHTSKTGSVTITVAQPNGVRFKTLARHVTKDGSSLG